MATRASLPQTTYTDAEGNPLALGYLLIKLSEDAMVASLQLSAGVTVQLPLDNNGEITGSGEVDFYANSDLSPSDTMYNLRAFTANGQLVSDDWVSVTTGGSFGFGISFATSFAS